MKFKQVLERARKVQRAIIPKQQPTLENFDIYCKINPYYQVGGDYYDYMHLDGGKLGIAIADVAGKGYEAALLTSSVHAALDVSSRLGKPIKKVISELNNFIQKHTPEDIFATLIYGELDKEGNFNYCNAGHDPPLFYSNGNITLLNNSDIVLGFVKNAKYHNQSLKFNKGDILLLYTDGIVDSIGENGTSVLENILREYHNKETKRISNEIYNILSRYKQTDDQTSVIIKRNN